MENIKELIQVAVSDIWKVAEKKVLPTFMTGDGYPVPFEPFNEGSPLCAVAYTVVDFAEAQIDAYNTVLVMAGMEPMKLPTAPDHILNALSPTMREHYQ